MKLRPDSGSASSEPRRIATSSPSGHSAPKRLEPQTEQKAFTSVVRPEDADQLYLSGKQAEPVARDVPCVPPKAPECFRHREQWQ